MSVTVMRPELLDEHGDAGGLALLHDRSRPRHIERPRAGAALAADDHPIETTRRIGRSKRSRSSRRLAA
jgi:hypothetical protein